VSGELGQLQSDGDTITFLVGEHDSVKVRLAGIDAPEKAQPFASVSKKNLSDHVYEKNVTVEWEKKDRYGRVLGRVLVNGTDACLEQICAGLACGTTSSTPRINRQALGWHMKKLSDSPVKVGQDCGASQTLYHPGSSGIPIDLGERNESVCCYCFRDQ